MVIKRVMAAALVFLSMGAAACTAEVEEKGEAPSVDVDGGKMPKVDVDPAKVEVSSDTQQVVTPEVNVTPTEGSDK
ncbi:MAG TPA: hypothetical protein VF665_18270 [Longimicrobium sp.]|jgi:hypothetical protein|uniref:hypothetical protein n=1 Tax=Longimicrobium sp. TaxID=2029185 RepID=UPI002EDA1F4A